MVTDLNNKGVEKMMRFSIEHDFLQAIYEGRFVVSLKGTNQLVGLRLNS